MSPLYAFLNGWELVVIAFVILILFGSRLPSVMRNLGQGVTEFKKGVQGIDDETPEKRVE
jgi:sec-independent protein translocase protein TatA